MENLVDRLIAAIEEKENPCCVGLDPIFEKIPAEMKEEVYRSDSGIAVGEEVGTLFFKFNKSIIDAIKDLVPAVKPQAAFYEAYGLSGLDALMKTISYAHEQGLLVIVDAKRNDIGSTAEAYAQGWLRPIRKEKDWSSVFNADFLTVNPFLGSDGIKPFLQACVEEGKGVFVLAKTSNKSSGELQDLELKDGQRVYEVVARQIDLLGREVVGKRGYSAVGAVVGATYPEQAQRLRQLMPHTFFLVPGYGAQGATANDIVPCFNNDGYGALINSSRGIIYAHEQKKYYDSDFSTAVRAATIQMREEVVQALRQNDKLPASWR